MSLCAQLLDAVRSEGYDSPTPVQAQAIPHALAGRDLLVCAQTGTGKTAAFALPILQRLMQKPGPTPGPRALVLVPTRELAAQVAQSFVSYGKNTRLRTTVVFGGVSQHGQERELRRGVDILVAAPGRLLDLMEQRLISLSAVEVLVLDEADRMLDIGFIRPIRQIIAKVPRARQSMLLSATIPPSIRELAAQLLTNPVSVSVTPAAPTVEMIEQGVYHVNQAQKTNLLVEVLADRSADRVIVFTRTKHGANRLVDKLRRARIVAEAIHGNKSQNARQRALASFKSGSARVLVATDVAARGIDVDGISHVVNYDMPRDPESYVHRIGRTGRAGAAGIALSFCDHTEREHLVDIERLIRRKLPVRACARS